MDLRWHESGKSWHCCTAVNETESFYTFFFSGSIPSFSDTNQMNDVFGDRLHRSCRAHVGGWGLAQRPGHMGWGWHTHLQTCQSSHSVTADCSSL